MGSGERVPDPLVVAPVLSGFVPITSVKLIILVSHLTSLVSRLSPLLTDLLLPSRALLLPKS